MPIREIVNGEFIGMHINSSVYYGDLAKIIKMEQRITARTDEPVPSDSRDESTFRYGLPSEWRRAAACTPRNAPEPWLS